MHASIIVIEGLDGSGKETQSKLLRDKLLKVGKKVKYLSFPDYQSSSSELIKLYLSGSLGKDASLINPYAASSFYAIDRYISYNTKWKNFYDDGQIIISNRYTTSNAIYQMSKLEYDCWESYIKWLEDYEYNKLKLPKPDLVIYLSVSNEIGQDLLEKRYNGDSSKKDIHESNVEFLKKCKISAEYLCNKLLWEKVECCNGQGIKDIEEISQEIFTKVKSFVIKERF